MKLETLQDVEKLLKLCRKLGVESVRVGEYDTEFKLGPAPQAAASKRAAAKVQHQIIAPGGITDTTPIETTELTPDQLLMWSVTGGEPEVFDQN